MRVWFTLAKKDLLLLGRDRLGLFFILIFPLLFALFFGAIFAGDGERNSSALKIAIVNEATSDRAKAFAEKLEASDALRVVRLNRAEAEQAVRRGTRVAFIVLPAGLGEGSVMAPIASSPKLQLAVDPSRQAERGFLQGVIVQAWFAVVQDAMAKPEAMEADLAQTETDVAADENIPEDTRAEIAEFFTSMRRVNQLARDAGRPMAAGPTPPWSQRR